MPYSADAFRIQNLRRHFHLRANGAELVQRTANLFLGLNDGLQVVPISVNISRASLHYTNIVEEYEAMVKSVGILPRFVPLEITESATINIKDIYALIEKFANLGFKLHMDDFGRGYSSLSSLNVLPFSTIKIIC